MRNINTTKFWNKQFKKEYKFYDKDKKLVDTCSWRWNGERYGALDQSIGFNGSLLDIGCGLGHFCRYIKARSVNLDVHGIDFSNFAIEKAKQLADKTGMSIDFKVGDAQKIPHEDNKFDYVVSCDVIEHLDSPDRHLQEIKRVLKDNGTAIILTPWKNIYGEKLVSVEHIREWTPFEFKELALKYFKSGSLTIPHKKLDRVNGVEITPYWFIMTLK